MSAIVPLGEQQRTTPPLLLGFGIIAFLIAVLSIADMYIPRPYDGVVLDSDTPGEITVRQVVPGSGAALAGIHAGDHIVGIARSALRSASHAATLLNTHDIGEKVPYLVRTRNADLVERTVLLGPRQIGDRTYLVACVLGFAFFFIGLFVLMNQPKSRASRLFFVLCSLFLLFLICRLRPASFSWVDVFVLNTGTAALLFLPPTFFHFFLIFPHPVWTGRQNSAMALLENHRARVAMLAVLYAVPPAVFAIAVLNSRKLTLISGAPVANWWVLAFSIVLGLGALALNARRLPLARERNGAKIVFLGSLFGLVPFIAITTAMSSTSRMQDWLLYALIPLALVPLTFAYAIIRFQLLDVKFILRKSLLYTLTTAGVTVFYAVGIALFGLIFRRTEISTSPYFPIVFALTIVLLFEPVRRWVQGPVDRFFSARRASLQAAMMEMGNAFAAQTDPAVVVREVVDRLPQLLEFRYAALYILRKDHLERVAGPEHLPAALPHVARLSRFLREDPSIPLLGELGELRLEFSEIDRILTQLESLGVELIADLSTPRRNIGCLLISGKEGKLPLEPDELRLMRGLMNQAAIALETGILLEDRARQAELERELEIAATIQRSLLPASVELGPEWDVAAVCRPARQVGGDFFAELPGPGDRSRAVVYGDVSGKSVSGALMMMAAKEALHSLATVHRDPSRLFALANRRIYELGKRNFVALGYFTGSDSGCALRYVVAGQPQPLRLGADGAVFELPLANHRIPVGAMNDGEYEVLEVGMEPGDMVVAYSDGVIEAQNGTGEFFGSHRLLEVLRNRPSTPQEAVDRVLEELESFTSGTDPYDDVTLMVIARRPEVGNA